MQARRTDAGANTPDGIERAGALALESIEIARKSNRPPEADAIEAARSALIRLPLLVLSHGSWSGPWRCWRMGGWPAAATTARSSSGPRTAAGEPVVLAHGSRSRSLAVLPDGRLASGGDDGQIKLWPKDGRGEPVVLQHGSSVRSLAVLPDGRLASGGDDGKIKLWPKDGRGEPVILSARQPGPVPGGAAGRAAGQRRRRTARSSSGPRTAEASPWSSSTAAGSSPCLRPGDVARAASSAGRHDHAST